MKEAPIRESIPRHRLLEPSLLEALVRGDRKAFDDIFDAAFECVLAAVGPKVDKDVRALELTDRVLTAALASLDPEAPPESLARWFAAWTRQVLADEAECVEPERRASG